MWTINCCQCFSCCPSSDCSETNCSRTHHRGINTNDIDNKSGTHWLYTAVLLLSRTQKKIVFRNENVTILLYVDYFYFFFARFFLFPLQNELLEYEMENFLVFCFFHRSEESSKEKGLRLKKRWKEVERRNESVKKTIQIRMG